MKTSNKIEINKNVLDRVAIIQEKVSKAGNIVKLSNTSKLGVKSWSLQAYNTCPASIDQDGELVAACGGCYAAYGNYRFANVKASREYNRISWSHDNFVNDFVRVLQTERYFRWFDSGDMYSLGLANKIYEIMLNTPHVLHWLPTRMHKFKKFEAILQKMQSLPNVVIRLSSDGIDGSIVNSDVVSTNSTILPADNVDQYDGFICPAYKQDGKCNDCKACYSKDVKTVAYVAHGAVMKSKIKKIALANV